MDFKEGDMVVSNQSNGIYKFIQVINETTFEVRFPELHGGLLLVHTDFRLATNEEIAGMVAKRIAG